jgi:hypothetical protein
MNKIGVGVGDDFPVDDGNGGGQPGAQGPRSEQEEFEDWKRRRDAWRAEREQWRAQRDAWRARKRAFKEKVRAAARESFGDSANWHHGYDRRGEPYYHWRPRFWGLWALIPIFAILLFLSLIAAIFKSPFLFLALIGIGAFAILHRHRWDRRFDDYGYGGPRGPIVTPPPPSKPAGPPPAVTNGK